jgi:hypothetical protein
MKKSIYILASLLIFLYTNPILAQADPGDDPDAPAAPIDDYVWILVLVGLLVVYLKFRSIYKQVQAEAK